MVVFASIDGQCKALAKDGSIASRRFPYSFTLADIRTAAGQPQAIALETVGSAVGKPQIFSIPREKIAMLRPVDVLRSLMRNEKMALNIQTQSQQVLAVSAGNIRGRLEQRQPQFHPDRPL